MNVEVGSFGHVLAQESVGVLVGAALPGRMRIAEVDLHTSIDFELGVCCQLFALVPGDRSHQRSRQRADCGGHRSVDVVGGLAVRKMQEQHETGGALDQRADRGTVVGTHDQIAFPVARHRPIAGVGGRRCQMVCVSSRVVLT